MTRARDVIVLLYVEAARREQNGDKAGAERLRIKPPTLRQWVRRGHITRAPDGGYDWRQILAYIDRRDTP